jgi:hypothetical protein
MTEFGVISFDGIGICLALRNLVPAKVIPEPLIRIKTIAVIPFCFWRQINNLLDGFLSPYPDHRPTQNTAGFAVNNGQNVDSVFLSPMKVKISSISASWTSAGTGALGNASAASVTHNEMV